jgi:hypothetical protein
MRSVNVPMCTRQRLRKLRGLGEHEFDKLTGSQWIDRDITMSGCRRNLNMFGRTGNIFAEWVL